MSEELEASAVLETVSAPRVVQILTEAKLIASARDALDRMRLQGFGIPDWLYLEILAELGEAEGAPTNPPDGGND
jgi:hypothetical protein